MRAAIYARVSTERQERQQSIGSQLTSLRRWAEAEGHALAEAHVFRDEGYSGSRLDRPGADSGTKCNGSSEADLDVPAKLPEQRLHRGQEAEAFPRRQVVREHDLLQLGVGERVEVEVARQVAA